jgi:hypothetical protein
MVFVFVVVVVVCFCENQHVGAAAAVSSWLEPARRRLALGWACPANMHCGTENSGSGQWGFGTSAVSMAWVVNSSSHITGDVVRST